MKGLGKILVIIGVLLCIYSVAGKFVGAPTIGLGLIELDAISGVIMAIFIIVLAIALKDWHNW
jgi:hypothetical protein